MGEEERSDTDAGSVVATDLMRLCRLTTPAEIRGFRGDRLGIVSKAVGLSIDQTVATAVSRVPDERYRAAAYVLLVDPDLRSENMTARSSRAASIFGLNPDGFRRRRKKRRSARDEVLLEVAYQVDLLQDGADRHQTTGEITPPGKSHRGIGADEGLDPRPDHGNEAEHDDNHSMSTRSGGRYRGKRSAMLAIVGFLGVVSAGFIALPLLGGSVNDPGNSAAGISTAYSADVFLMAGEIDVTLHCRDTHGSDWSAHPTGADDLDWMCRSANGDSEVLADLGQACIEQYGPAAQAANRSSSVGDWRCEIAIPHALADATCAIEPGDFDSSTSYDFAPYAAAFRQRHIDGGGAEVLGCPVTMIHRWGTGVLQELGDGDQVSGALLSGNADNDTVLLVGPSWEAFDRIKGITGAFVGYPVSEPTQRRQVWEIPLDGGGVLVSKRQAGQYLWIPPVVYDLWISLDDATGCLGLPLTDPYVADGQFRQDFENGRLALDPLAGTLQNESAAC